MTNIPALSSAERNRLIGILGRLGSDFDGERAAAGLLASRMLRSAGLTWEKLLSQEPTLVVSGAGMDEPHPSDDLALCRRHRDELTPWEQNFCQSLAGRTRRSAKQLGILQGIADALRRRGFV